MTLGERLRKAREHARLSQQALEERSGVSQKTISKIERGDQEGSTQIAALAIACGVRMEWLATEAGEMLTNRAEQPVGTYSVLSDAALGLARAFDTLSKTSQASLLAQLELVQQVDAGRARSKAERHDVRIRRGAIEKKTQKRVS